MKKKGNKVRNDKNFKPHLLAFKHRRLTKDARAYQHEIQHITVDLVKINRKIQRAAVLCQRVINTAGQKNKAHLVEIDKDLSTFEDLHYHLENSSFRVHAYRDKMCVFVNCALKLGYDKNESGLQNKLIKNKIIIDNNLDTELKKFNKLPLTSILSKRKLMSHKIYYGSDEYDPILMPNISPKQVGIKKIRSEWNKRVKKEIEASNKCFLKLAVDLNVKVTNKVIKFLDAT